MLACQSCVSGKPRFLSLSPADLPATSHFYLDHILSMECIFFLPKSLGMFVVFRNVISARFLRSNVPDRSWLLMKQLSAHHQRFCRDEVCEHV